MKRQVASKVEKGLLKQEERRGPRNQRRMEMAGKESKRRKRRKQFRKRGKRGELRSDGIRKRLESKGTGGVEERRRRRGQKMKEEEEKRAK